MEAIHEVSVMCAEERKRAREHLFVVDRKPSQHDQRFEGVGYASPVETVSCPRTRKHIDDLRHDHRCRPSGSEPVVNFAEVPSRRGGADGIILREVSHKHVRIGEAAHPPVRRRPSKRVAR